VEKLKKILQGKAQDNQCPDSSQMNLGDSGLTRSERVYRARQMRRAKTRKFYDLDNPTSRHMTKQEFAAESDINTIMKKYERSGISIETLSRFSMQTLPENFKDLTGPIDHKAALDMLDELHSTFDNLPARIRDRFHNNPYEFVDFFSHAENQEEAIKLGLARRIETPPASGASKVKRDLSDLDEPTKDKLQKRKEPTE